MPQYNGNENRNLRGEETAVIQRPEAEFLHATVTFRGAVLWNELPPKIRNERNYERFKKAIKQIDLDQMDFCTYNQGRRQSVNWGGGGIHIFRSCPTSFF